MVLRMILHGFQIELWYTGLVHSREALRVSKTHGQGALQIEKFDVQAAFKTLLAAASRVL
jgi:hypothetical protein